MELPIVKLNEGTVLGRIDHTLSGFPYYSFQGMRYAKPPIDELRFKDPEPIDSWDGIYDATHEGFQCAQANVLIPHIHRGHEDCLFINVYTPRKPSLFSAVQILLPVMVWFHGGGYVDGSGNTNLFGPDYIVEQNVTLITINYRLGVFGFLNLGIEEVPGNAGLKDHVMALKWVKKNIKHFGGNPNDVTIFGESAGGSSVQFLMLSPMAKGLFHKAISQSGSCLNNWIYTPDSINPLEKAIALVKLSGKNVTNPRKILEILRSWTTDDLLENAVRLRTIEEIMRDAAFPFAPSKERKFKKQLHFLTKSTPELFCTGRFHKVPYLAGYNSADGIYYAEYAQLYKGYIENLSKNFQFVVPIDMNLPMNSSESIEIAKKIKEYYFGSKEVNENTMEEFINLYTDFAFLEKVDFTARLISRHSNAPVYFYRFSFDGDLNAYKKRYKLKYKGASHLDDLGYLFRENIIDLPTEVESASSLQRKRMVKMWTNFAKHGNPTPEVNDLIKVTWEPVTEEEFKYLDIGKELTMAMDPEKERIVFWRILYGLHAKNKFLVC